MYYPSTDQVSVFVAIDFLVILEHTVTGAGTHEVIVALTRGQAAAHCGAGLVAAFTSLTGHSGLMGMKDEIELESVIRMYVCSQESQTKTLSEI